MGGVVDFLATKVPDVETDRFGIDGNVPFSNCEPVGLGLVSVVSIV